MENTSLFQTSLSVDLVKYRIRVFKSTIHLLGDPKYIQLLVSPTKKEVAIRAVDKELAAAQMHKVDQKRMVSDLSIEIYSRAFVEKLCEVAGPLEGKATYRINGEVRPDKRIAIFALKTIKQVEAPNGTTAN